MPRKRLPTAACVTPYGWQGRVTRCPYFGMLLFVLVSSWSPAHAISYDDVGPQLYAGLLPSRFSITAGIEPFSDANLETDGEMGMQRVTVGARGAVPLSTRWLVGLNALYRFDTYDFSGETGFAGLDPWEDVHHVAFAVRLSYRASERWRILGGPAFRVQAESGVAVSQGFTASGSIGATYRFNKRFMLGAGLGISSQIEHGVRFGPLVFMHWQITERFWLTVRGLAAEVHYTFSGGWEAAIGTASASSRFRLDDAGVAPDGVGKVSRRLLQARISYAITPHLTVEARGGMALAGELKLEDEDGNDIREEDIDPAPFLGVFVTLRF